MPSVEALWLALREDADRPALKTGDAVVTCGALVNAIVRRMVLLDESGATRVALALDNGIEWAAWDLALLFSGRICVPVPGFFSPAQKVHVLESAGVDTCIGAEPPQGAAGFECHSPGVWKRAVAQAAPLPEGTRKITYTSGTTGNPKGVCLDAKSLLAVADSVHKASAALDIRHHLCVLPLATLLENVAGLYAPLLKGACVDLRPMQEIGLKGASGFDVGQFLRVLNESRPHSVILLPQLLLALVAAAEAGHRPPPSLRFIAVGGARVSPALLHRADTLGLPVYEGYGLSECASVACLNTPQARRIGTVGRPLPHVELRVADDGEIHVRGSRLLGYVGEAPHGDDWLATGDLGTVENGFVTLIGRRKSMFITAYGRNVNPEWVEAELVLQSPIAQAWLHGEARAENVAVLVPRGEGISDADLQSAVDRVNERLPDYARVHRWLRAREPFTQANGLATPNGRLRRDALAATHFPTEVSA